MTPRLNQTMEHFRDEGAGGHGKVDETFAMTDLLLVLPAAGPGVSVATSLARLCAITDASSPAELFDAACDDEGGAAHRAAAVEYLTRHSITTVHELDALEDLVRARVARCMLVCHVRPCCPPSRRARFRMVRCACSRAAP